MATTLSQQWRQRRQHRTASASITDPTTATNAGASEPLSEHAISRKQRRGHKLARSCLAVFPTEHEQYIRKWNGNPKCTNDRSFHINCNAIE